MVTEICEGIIYCSPGTSSSKQNKTHFTSRPQFRCENTLATIQADQIWLALKQLANNSNFTKFHNKKNRISKFPKWLNTTMPTFDGKSENFDLFEDLFQPSPKIHNQLTEDDRINYFQSFMKREMRYRQLKTSAAQPERIWEKSFQFFVGSTWNTNRWWQHNTKSRNLTSIQQTKSW